MVEGKKSPAFLVTLIVIVFILAAAGGGVYYAYEKQKKSLASAIAEMPAFDEETNGKEAAKQIGCAYPVAPPELSLKKISDKINGYVREKSSEKFSKEAYSKKIMEISDKYRFPKYGDIVSFQMLIDNSFVKGKFKGVEHGTSMTFVKVGDNKYPLDDIMDEYRYMFSKTICDKVKKDKLTALRESFTKSKIEFANQLKKKIENNYIPKKGYSKAKNGKWIPNSAVFAKLMAERKTEFEKDRLRRIKKLKEEKKLFGFIPVPAPEEIEKELNKK